MGYYDSAYSNIGSMGLKGVAGVASVYTMGKQLKAMKGIETENKVQAIDTVTKAATHTSEANDLVTYIHNEKTDFLNKASQTMEDDAIMRRNGYIDKANKALEDLQSSYNKMSNRQMGKLMIAQANISKDKIVINSNKRDILKAGFNKGVLNIIRDSQKNSSKSIAETSKTLDEEAVAVGKIIKKRDDK